MVLNHLKLAHLIWKEHLLPGMTVIDATAGNGHDSLFLARQVLQKDAGWMHVFDIQEIALNNTKSLLRKESFLERITFHHSSHETFPVTLSEIDLIAYNLGYLPGGDKSITTLPESTLKSCKHALEILKPGGILSITLYPRHSQGALEKIALFSWLETLNYTITHHYSLNSPNSPSIIILQKRHRMSLTIS